MVMTTSPLVPSPSHVARRRTILDRGARAGIALGLTSGLLIGLAPAVVNAAAPLVYQTKWGSEGPGNGQFEQPHGIAVDKVGNVYVADWGWSRIQKFTSNGAFIRKWGDSGDGAGQLASPEALAIDKDGFVYVVDSTNNRVTKFDSNGSYVTEWGQSGHGNGDLSVPIGVAVDHDNNVYVAERGNNRVQKFSSTGIYLTKWSPRDLSSGAESFLTGIAVDKDENVYVADSVDDFIRKFTSTGTFLTKWGGRGAADGEFTNTGPLSIDPNGIVYAIDDDMRIQSFTTSGAFLSKFSSWGHGNGQLWSPDGIAADTTGHVFVSDVYDARVQRFGPPAAATGRPDARVRLGSSGAFHGDGVYNLTAAGQAVSGSAKAGHALTFNVSLQNDGSAADRLRLKGLGSTNGYTVKYRSGATDVTAAVVAGTYTTSSLARGAAATISVVVTVKSAAKVGSQLGRLLTVSSVASPTRQDAVKVTAKRS